MTDHDSYAEFTVSFRDLETGTTKTFSGIAGDPYVETGVEGGGWTSLSFRMQATDISIELEESID